MIARDATIDDIEHVLRNLRPRNRREFECTRWDARPRAIAAEIASHDYFCIKHFALCREHGPPVALAGAWMVAPGVALVRLCATDEWPTIARPVHRWLKRVFIPCVLKPNVRRAETRVLRNGPADDRETLCWLHALGFKTEGIALALGRNGESFWHVAWINPEHGGDPCATFSANYSAPMTTQPNCLA